MMTHQQMRTYIEPFKEGITPMNLESHFKELVKMIDQLLEETIQIQLGEYVISREKSGKVWITHITHEAMMLNENGKELEQIWKKHF